MFLELIYRPITATKKLLHDINKNILIGISIAIPLLIALIPSLVVDHMVGSFLKSLSVLGTMINMSTNIQSYVFKAMFKWSIVVILVITGSTFALLLIYSNYKKLKISKTYIWKSMMAAAIQIIYYLTIGGILSLISVYLFSISFIGIINAVLCLHTLIVDCNEIENLIEQDMNSSAESESAAALCESTDFMDPLSSAIANSTTNQVDKVEAKVAVVSATQRIISLAKSQKKIFIPLGVSLLLIVVLLFTANSLTSKENVSSKLSKAIKDNNAKVMAKYIVSSDPRLKITEESLGSYIQYLKENPSYASKLIQSIDSQGKSTDKSSVPNTLDDNKVIKLTTKGKKYILFNNYVYQLPAYFIKVSTEYKNTEVSLDNKPVYTSDGENSQKECGPYLPGKYKLEGKLKTDYVEVTGSQDIVLDPQKNLSNTINIDLKLNGSKLSLYTNYKDAKILVNGKDTGVTVEKIDSLVPLPVDGSCKVQLEKQFPWGPLKSNEQVFGKDSLQLKFGGSELVDLVKSGVTEFVKSYVEAYKAFDASKLATVTDSYKKSTEDNINFKKHYSKPYTGTLASITIDQSNVTFDTLGLGNSDNYAVSVPITFSGDLVDGYNSSLNNDSYTIRIEYDADQKKWLVDDMRENWFAQKVKDGIEIKLN